MNKWSDIRKGDIVTLRHIPSDAVVTFTALREADYFDYTYAVETVFGFLLSTKYALTNIERRYKLPTEFGVYTAADTDKDICVRPVYQLNEDGWHIRYSIRIRADNLIALLKQSHLTLKRLVIDERDS